MPFPDLSHLPAWAQVLIYAILGISLGIAFIVARFGISNGQKAAPSGVAQAQVAAVIVDPTALNAAAAEVSGLAIAVHELVSAVKTASENHKRTAEELDAIREEMRIHREVSRR